MHLEQGVKMAICANLLWPLNAKPNPPLTDTWNSQLSRLKCPLIVHLVYKTAINPVTFWPSSMSTEERKHYLTHTRTTEKKPNYFSLVIVFIKSHLIGHHLQNSTFFRLDVFRCYCEDSNATIMEDMSWLVSISSPERKSVVFRRHYKRIKAQPPYTFSKVSSVSSSHTASQEAFSKKTI